MIVKNKEQELEKVNEKHRSAIKEEQERTAEALGMIKEKINEIVRLERSLDEHKKVAE